VYEVQGQAIDMQQNVRAALDFICRELRHAGYGVDNGTTIFSNLVNNDAADPNIDNGTDAITFVGNSDTGSLAAADTAAGATTLTVLPAPGRTLEFRSGSLINLLDWKKNLLGTGLTVQAVSFGNPTTLTLTSGPTANVRAGSIVTVQPGTLSYRVRSNTLERNQGAGFQPLIGDVEDFQLVYAFDNNDDGDIDTDANGIIWAVDSDNNGTLDTRVNADGTTAALGSAVNVSGNTGTCRLRAVRVSISVRTARQNPDPRYRSQYRRPRVEDHTGASVNDGFRRQVLQGVVKFRNVGLVN